MEFVLVYLDEIVMFSKTPEKYIDHVKQLLTLLQCAEATLKLKKLKMLFFHRQNRLPWTRNSTETSRNGRLHRWRNPKTKIATQHYGGALFPKAMQRLYTIRL